MSEGRPRVFFRADASPEVGLGHVRRCAVLAKACQQMGAEVHLLARWRGVSKQSAGGWEGACVHELNWDASAEADAKWLARMCRHEGLAVGVIDHYRQDENYQRHLIKEGLNWLQFGNVRMTIPLWGRWVHDATPGATAEGYSLRNTRRNVQWLLGPEYALVAASFGVLRRTLGAPELSDVNSVLVIFGGGNDCGATERALGWLEASGFTGRRVVLSGSTNPSLPRLRELAQRAKDIELHEGNWDPSSLMAGCQLAVCSGGITLHELACLGIPAMIVTIADNQEAPALAWQKMGMGTFLGDLHHIQDWEAVACLKACLADTAGRLVMAQTAWTSQDGEGAARVAAELVTAAKLTAG